MAAARASAYNALHDCRPPATDNIRFDGSSNDVFPVQMERDTAAVPPYHLINNIIGALCRYCTLYMYSDILIIRTATIRLLQGDV